MAFITSLPRFMNVLWRMGMGVLSVWAAFLLLASLMRRRFQLLRDEVLSMVAAGVAASIVDAIVGGGESSMWGSLLALGPPADRVSLRIAFATAVIATALPHLVRPFRRLSRWLIVLGGLSAAIASAATPSGVVLGFLCGLASAAAIHLALGSTDGRPSVEEVEKGLADVGVEVTSLSEARVQSAGVFLLYGTDNEGRPLEVKLYGRDAWDAQLMAKAWRALWFRDAESLSLTRLQQAEHEGFLTLLAARRGVPTLEVVQAGRTADNDALIVLRPRGISLVEERTVGEPLVAALWTSVLAFSDAGFAHGDLAPSDLRIDGDEVVIDGLGRAVLASSIDQRLVDLAQALTLSALLIGPDVAVELASNTSRRAS